MKKLSFLQKWSAIIVSFCALVCIVVGMFVKNSYTDDVQKLANNADTIFWLFAETEIPDENYDLLWNADIIVRATAKDTGFVSMDGIRVTLTVNEVYKGRLKQGDVFNFWQDSLFAYDSINGMPVFFARTLVNIIQPGKEYVVFANEQYVNEEYKKYMDVPSYIPANYPLYDPINFNAISYFDIVSNSSKLLNQQDVESYKVTYADVRNNEINCYSQEDANAYYELKRKIFNELKIDVNN